MSHHFIPMRSALSALLILAPAASAQVGVGTNGTTEIISLDSSGALAAGISRHASMSHDGRYVVFESDVGLVPFDLNGRTDIYVLDRQSGTLQVASRTAAGFIGNNDSFGARISGDGRYVVFTSHATNLVQFDSNGESDVMRKDLVSGALVRVSTAAGSLASANGQSLHPSISDDGRFVAFQSDASDLHPAGANGFYDVYVRDMHTSVITCESRAVLGGPSNGHSYRPAISADGGSVAFHTAASNSTLFDTNGAMDVVVRNLSGGGIARVSSGLGGAASNAGSFNASISADGRYVAFVSDASNLVSGDDNGVVDVFVRDRDLDFTVNASVALDGGAANSGSTGCAISADGRHVAFVSGASDLVLGGPALSSIYVRDLERGATYLASRSTGPVSLPNSSSSRPALSGDGAMVVFDSGATNLVQGDTNGQWDVFLRSMLPDPLVYCASSVTSAGCTPALSSEGLPRASQDSGFVVTCSNAPNNKSGLAFYGFGGRQNVPFGAGTFCMLTPVARTPVAFSGGNPPTVDDCSGAFQLDMNAFAKGLLGVSAPAALAQVGQRVNLQYWGRDPQGAIATTFLSDALEYVVGP